MDRTKEKTPTVSTTAGEHARENTKENGLETPFSDTNIIPQRNQDVKSFRCNIDTVGYKTKDEAKKKTGAIVNRTKTEKQIIITTAEMLAEAVTKGFSFTTAALKGTKEADFVSQQLLIADIDNEADIIKAEKLSEEFKKREKAEKTLDEAYKILEAHGIEKTPFATVDGCIELLERHSIKYSFIYYSFSHSTIRPKFRIVCVLDKPITDPAEAKRLNQYFISLFPQADKSCFNLDRFYYGTDKGLATTVHNRTTTITVPLGWSPEQSEPEKTAPKEGDAPPISEDEAKTNSEKSQKNENEASAKQAEKDKNDDNFDLTQAIRSFNLLAYIEQTEGRQGKQHGKDILFNPCPLCGHKDDFYVDTTKNLFKCHSSHNGKGGNIITYIEQKRGYDRKAAREYFIYDILKRDRNADKSDYKRDKGRPKKEKSVDGDKINSNIVSIEAVQKYLDEKGVVLKYNVISRKASIQGLDEKYSEEHKTDTLPAIVHNDLKFVYERCPKGDIQDALSVISSVNRFNPVLEMLNSAEWDGIDRIFEIFGILHIDPNDRLSQTLLYKWYWQGLSMARNELKDAYGADGALVLQGGQGIGKTSFVRKTAVHQEFCSIGKSLNFQDKDTIRRCGSNWIVELGEIETTFKSDKEKLKAFITDEIDMYRLPYGRADVELARRASLIGTCNSTEYLIDETGNRRFWTIPLTEIDLKTLERFDALQLWVQIDRLTKENRQGFRLTEEERNQLAIRNSKHEKPLKGETEVRDVFDMADREANGFTYKMVTVTEFIMSYEALKKFDARQIGQVLNKMGIKESMEYVDGKRARLRKLPFRKFINSGLGNFTP